MAYYDTVSRKYSSALISPATGTEGAFLPRRFNWLIELDVQLTPDHS